MKGQSIISSLISSDHKTAMWNSGIRPYIRLNYKHVGSFPHLIPRKGKLRKKNRKYVVSNIMSSVHLLASSIMTPTSYPTFFFFPR